MTIIANTFLKYNAIGVREDLSNIITMISPETRPFMSNMTKKRSVTNTFFEWQTHRSLAKTLLCPTQCLR